MNYKLISMDFDGTILTSDKRVTEKSKKKLLEYKNENYIIVGITAKNFSSVNNVCDINIFNYLILNNGAYMYDVENKNGITFNNIYNDMAIKITKCCEDIADEIDYCSLNNYYIYKKSDIENKSYRIEVSNINEVKEEISRMNIFLKRNEEIEKYKNYIQNMFDSIDVFIMSDTDSNNSKKWLSLNPKGMDKYKALEELCLKLNISTEEVIFFGDSANDLSIINKVGLGVAMENALPEVKEKAKAITLSNDEDGIVKFLEKINI